MLPTTPGPKLRQKNTFLRSPHELRRRLYIPGQGRALEKFGVPRYLPTRVNGWNETDLSGFTQHHYTVLQALEHDHIRLTGGTGDDPSVACCIDVKAGRRPLRVLLLYFDRPLDATARLASSTRTSTTQLVLLTC